MESDSVEGLIIVFVLVSVQGFFSLARSSLVNLRKVDIRHGVEEGQAQAKLVERLTEDSTRLLATFQVCMTIVSALTIAVAALTLQPALQSAIADMNVLQSLSGLLAVLLVVGLTTFVLLVFADLVPEAVAATHSDSWAFVFARPTAILVFLTRPLVALVVQTSDQLSVSLGGRRLRGMPFVTEEEIMTMVDASQEGGLIQEDEKQMIYSIFALDDTRAREVMVPRIDLVTLDVETTVEEALAVVIDAGHSRIPVYEDNIDNIVGLLYAKDLLSVWRDGRQFIPLRDLLRPAYFVPESKKVPELLGEMQQRKIHMAVVVDEYGGTAGVVTVEDIVEEIVGEIQDEYDSEEPSVRIVSDNEFVFDARIDLDDVNRLMDTELPTELGDTLGGFIYSQLGRVPAVGAQVLYNNLCIQVMTVSGRRIRTVRITRELGRGQNGNEHNGTAETHSSGH